LSSLRHKKALENFLSIEIKDCTRPPPPLEDMIPKTKNLKIDREEKKEVSS